MYELDGSFDLRAMGCGMWDAGCGMWDMIYSL